MEIDTSAIITALVLVSSASERGTEFIKTTFKLNERITSNDLRVGIIHVINLILNLVIFWGIWAEASKGFPSWLATYWGLAVLSLMACGGSNVWHSVLGFGESIKINKKDATTTSNPIGFIK